MEWCVSMCHADIEDQGLGKRKDFRLMATTAMCLLVSLELDWTGIGC